MIIRLEDAGMGDLDFRGGGGCIPNGREIIINNYNRKLIFLFQYLQNFHR